MYKIIYKPWGEERWIELNEFYCCKHILINRGYRTSLQYHEKKMETMYIFKGEAEIQTGDNRVKLSEGEYITIPPNIHHRVTAITDLIIHEVSTPEVDDVQRIDDDTHRPSGRINKEHETPALCILMAGKSTRLGEMCKYINKGLLPVENKAAISHIIDKVSPQFDIVLAVSHGSELIKEYCDIAHQDRNIEYVHVDDIDSPKSGPGYSLKCCDHLLQRPFYVITADCLISDPIPNISGNWLGVQPTGMPEIYSTAKVNDDMEITAFKNKDKNGYNYAFIGLCAILDYEIFWKHFDDYLQNGELVDVFTQPSLLPGLSANIFDWVDIGTIENYAKHHANFTMPKPGAFTYHINNTCIKAFAKEESSQNRIKRSAHIKQFIPKIEHTGKNIYSYHWVPGKTLYEVDSFKVMKKFIEWCGHQLWEPSSCDDIEKNSMEFYKTKTEERVNNFIGSNKNMLQPHTINGLECLSISDYLDLINWDDLSLSSIPTTQFHGDLQFGNVIYDGSFTLIDWRDTFGGSTTHGDVYYDLAKMYGGIYVPYNKMDELSANILGNNVSYQYNRSKPLHEIEPFFIHWAESRGYDIRRIRIITSLIYLNMSPLHNIKFGELLFFMGIEQLEKIRLEETL